jgi:hypothetical protein
VFIRSTASAAPAGSAKNTPWANLTVSKNRSTGAPGSLPVKNNQSTALIAANSAAPPAKNSRMASGLPQMRRVTGEDKVGWYMRWYMRCLSVVGDIDDVPRFANGEYNRGRAAMTAVERRLSPLTEVLMCSLSTRRGRGDSTKQAQA